MTFLLLLLSVSKVNSKQVKLSACQCVCLWIPRQNLKTEFIADFRRKLRQTNLYVVVVVVDTSSCLSLLLLFVANLCNIEPVNNASADK